jgi:hypothetical protein
MIDDTVPIAVPNGMAEAKPESVSPPNWAGGRLARKTVLEMPTCGSSFR